MIAVKLIQDLFAYHYALYQRVWESVMTLTDDLFARDLSYSHGSIRNQILHVATTDGRWLRGLKGQADAREYALTPTDYPTRRKVRAVWDATEQDVIAYIEAMDEEELRRQPRGMNGPVWQVLVHLVNHGTDHRAQLLMGLNQLGAPTFDQDLIFYLWARD
jgi:uncharacterized damage-inducible protein DinB